MVNLRSEQGAMSIPPLLFAIVITVSGFRVWGFMRTWRFQMETQLRLDQCVGKATLELRDTFNQLATYNTRIHKTRATIQAAMIIPKAQVFVPQLKVVLKAFVFRQELIRMNWMTRQATWVANRGCSERGDLALPLPSLRFKRSASDHVGEQALKWTGDLPKTFCVDAWHLPRRSAACIQGGTYGEWEKSFSSKNWKAEWSPPFPRAKSQYERASAD